MAEALERLYKLTVDATQAVNSLDKIAKSTAQMNKQFADLGKQAKNIFAGVVAGASLKGIIDAAEKLNALEGSFKALRGSAEEASDLMQRVFGIVSTTGASLGAVSEGVQRLAIGMQSMGANNDQIEAVAENFIKIGRVGGSSMADINGALVQFSQAMASGVLQGDEFRSMSERLPLLMNRLAKELGVTQGELKKMGSEGKITADVLGNTLIKAGAELQAEFAQLPETFEQGINRIQASAAQMAKVLYDSTELGQTMQLTFKFVATEMDKARQGMGGWSGVLDGIGAGFKVIAAIVAGVVNGVNLVGGAVQAVGRSLGAIASGQYGELKNIWGDYLAQSTEASRTTQTLFKAFMGSADAIKSLNTEAGKAAANVALLSKPTTKSVLDPKAMKAAADAAAKMADRIAQQGLELAKLAGGLNSAEEYTYRYITGLEKVTQAEYERILAMKQYGEELKKQNDATDELFAAQDRLDEAARAETKAWEDRKNALLDQLVPMRQVDRQIAEIQRLMREGSIDQWLGEDAIANIVSGLQKVGTTAESMGMKVQDVFSSNFDSFFKNLERGTADVADAFKRMAQSIIAQLLRIGLTQGLNNLFPSLGLKFAAGGALRGATGLPQGVYTQPTAFAMPTAGVHKFANGVGLLGEAGPEAIMPLKRLANGKLGVEAAAAAQVNVNVVNNAGAEVSVQQNGNDIAIIIDRVKQSIIGDVRRGGNAVAGAFQNTYGLNRGARA